MVLAAVLSSIHDSGADGASVAAPVVRSGFQESTVVSGLTNPTNVRFASDGRVFVAEKSGILKEFDSLGSTTPTIVADLRAQVDDYWDRGLLGLALDPAFPAQPYVYLSYTFDAPIGGVAPVWNDGCPTPPGPTTDGCVVSGRLVRLQLSGNTMVGSPQVLINDWCQQYPSHSIGDLAFGPDGALYVSGGDGASWSFADYGQGGGSSGSPTAKNPCGDPPVSVGGTQSPPTAEGGSLRSQSFRRPTGEPVSLDGTILRVDPSTGAALSDNPAAANPNANARRIVAYGLRNPFRIAFRPGTSELWLGDVGADAWEEINRRQTPTAAVQNFGWPCYEAFSPQPAFQSAGLNLCSSLYTAGTSTDPYFAYSHGSTVVAGESCPTANGSSISAIGFYQSGSYPAAYDGALFFGDHSRKCIWAMPVGSNGLPDQTKLETFVTDAANPVDIEAGPGGDIFYVDLEGGTLRRLSYVGSGGGGVPVSGSVPVVSGFVGQGQSLSASTGSWSGSPTSFAYQWQRCDAGGAGCQPLSGGTGQSYRLVAADVGQTVRVAVTATNGAGASLPAYSAVTVVVRADKALAQPASASSTESAATGPQFANDGNSATRWSSAYVDGEWWQVDLGSLRQVDTVALNWETAYASSYKVQVSTDGSIFTDVATVSLAASGWKLTSFTAVSARYVRVLATTRATQWGSSLWDAQVFGPSDVSGGGGVPVSGSVPVVSGFVGQGQSLSASTGSWSGSPTSFAYQWQRCDAGGAGCQPLSGGTGQSYRLVAADVGQTVRVAVTATNGAGASLPAYSAVTVVVRADKALAQPASASSTESAATGPQFANDGNSATRWSSAYVDGEWWQVDLGSLRQVDTVALNWETAYASSYKVQVSTDGSIFTDVATVSLAASGWKLTSFTAVSARYVRVLATTRATQWGSSLWDAQVFGPSDAVNGPPTPVIDTPNETLTWVVGDAISFSGHASDPQQGALPATALTWTAIMHHCTTPTTCHTHLIQTFTGVASGSFSAPDHDYPSWLELQLTATDAGSLSTSTSVRLDPKTVDLSFNSSPTGLTLAVGLSNSTAPFTRTVIVNSANSISAPLTQTLGGLTYQFSSWSDGGAATHNITAPASAPDADGDVRTRFGWWWGAGEWFGAGCVGVCWAGAVFVCFDGELVWVADVVCVSVAAV